MYAATVDMSTVASTILAYGEEREGQGPAVPGLVRQPAGDDAQPSAHRSRRGGRDRSAARVRRAARQHRLRGRRAHTHGRAGRQPPALARRRDAAGGTPGETGLVHREIPPDDRRATYAVITPKGRELLEKGFPAMQQAVMTHWVDHLTDDEIAALRG